MLKSEFGFLLCVGFVAVRCQFEHVEVSNVPGAFVSVGAGGVLGGKGRVRVLYGG